MLTMTFGLCYMYRLMANKISNIGNNGLFTRSQRKESAFHYLQYWSIARLLTYLYYTSSLICNF